MHAVSGYIRANDNSLYMFHNYLLEGLERGPMIDLYKMVEVEAQRLNSGLKYFYIFSF